MESLSVTCLPVAVTFPPLHQPKAVIDLATVEGCKAELTWVVVICQDSLPTKDCQLSNNWAVSWSGIEPATESRKSNALNH